MVFGTATAVEATTPPADPVTTDSGSDDEDSDKTGLWGLLGLAGLAGLAGLKRRDDYTHDRRDTTTTGGSSVR